MAVSPELQLSPPRGLGFRSWLSRASLAVSLCLLAATFFLISPPGGRTYPGAIPWSDASLLKPIIDAMSLGGSVATARGVEIKDFAFHLVAAVGLGLLALRALVSFRWPTGRSVKGAWFYAQGLLAAWVALAWASCWWSRDVDISLGQATLYGLALAWAVALAWTLETRDATRVLGGLVAVSAVGAALCVWYFLERNPNNRPGFPIGNPSALAACVLPGVIIAGCALVGSVVGLLRRVERTPMARLVGAGLALVPLLWCLWLTHSRAALYVGLPAAVLTVVLLQVGRRTRWVVVALTVVLGAIAAQQIYSARFDLAMGRGASMRFRGYAWQYAAALWWQRPISGIGAGSYPCLASALAVQDRALDPAAFMGDLVEHAHNELFEVLTEIGLVGGVTFVGGLVATIAAGLALLRVNLSDERRWLLVGLLAAIVALLADAMFGVGPRLPGVPAVFYTLLGVLWAVCRCTWSSQRRAAGMDADSATPREQLKGPLRRRAVVAVGSAALALLAGIVAGRNWSGVLYEQRARDALREQRYAAALVDIQTAESRLLDPVRKLAAEETAVLSRYGLARQAVARMSPADRDLGEVLGLYEQAYVAALGLDRRAPTFRHMQGIAARCAERLRAGYGAVGQPQAAAEWHQAAWRAWSIQRAQSPYDLDTLLALSRYPGTMQEQIALLRDALRDEGQYQGGGRSEVGMPPAVWQRVLRELSDRAEFGPTLAAFVGAVGPINPQTHLDNLVASMAPEVYRLQAAWAAASGAFDQAEAAAERAAALYEPMRTRFPILKSVAWAEQAEYALRHGPDEPARSAKLIQQAIEALPRIQPQKYAQLARPFRVNLARYLLCQGRETEADMVLLDVVGDPRDIAAAAARIYVELTRTFIRRPIDERPPVRAWLAAARRRSAADREAWAWTAWLEAEAGDVAAVQAVLRDAAAAGVKAEDVRRMRESLISEFPNLREELERE